jgi:hypothetical protein
MTGNQLTDLRLDVSRIESYKASPFLLHPLQYQQAGCRFMSSDQVTCGGANGFPVPHANGPVLARVRAALASHFAWPDSVVSATEPLRDLSAVMDLDKLARLASLRNNGKELAFAIVSREYAETGLNWIRAMRRIGLDNFLIIAGDPTTAEMLDELGISNVLADIDESTFDPSFLSSTGFSAKGLAVSAFKFPVVRFLVQSGYSVVLSDADAVWLRDPLPYLRSSDIAFQRIVYHPQDISMLWGFAACGGFVSFRYSTGCCAFLDRCVDENRLLFDDQVVLNLALLGGDPEWYCENADWALPAEDSDRSRSHLETAFRKWAKFAITGQLEDYGLRVTALPHDKFWRHGIVPNLVEQMVVCHPNSPKDDGEKIKLLTSMGLRF